ncbi:hypothetical protein ABID22_003180 [Pontibacter aydingkolensis]|uniref:Uncharacterized protein n=1 Tax=Pontibacter aydingkolensis TaxID=1911536 RepID=A0ABS7CY54_9BACT|nr:hypothetical protein [Pontibacter aydingkolensis]MBW7468755.1 hypothetical protein [Pontibacter aydingkolensis]
MEAVNLNQHNSAFRIEGNEKTRSINLKSIHITKMPEKDTKLSLLVLDEKDIPIYNQMLDVEKDNSVVIEKRFVFYDHLSVKVEADKIDTSFSAMVSFELD